MLVEAKEDKLLETNIWEEIGQAYPDDVATQVVARTCELASRGELPQDRWLVEQVDAKDNWLCVHGDYLAIQDRTHELEPDIKGWDANQALRTLRDYVRNGVANRNEHKALFAQAIEHLTEEQKIRCQHEADNTPEYWMPIVCIALPFPGESAEVEADWKNLYGIDADDFKRRCTPWFKVNSIGVVLEDTKLRDPLNKDSNHSFISFAALQIRLNRDGVINTGVDTIEGQFNRLNRHEYFGHCAIDQVTKKILGVNEWGPIEEGWAGMVDGSRSFSKPTEVTMVDFLASPYVNPLNLRDPRQNEYSYQVAPRMCESLRRTMAGNGGLREFATAMLKSSFEVDTTQGIPEKVASYYSLLIKNLGCDLAEVERVYNSL